MYSEVSIIRPGHSRLLHFKQKISSTGHLLETFSKHQDQDIIERVGKYINKTVLSNFSEIVLFV